MLIYGSLVPKPPQPPPLPPLSAEFANALKLADPKASPPQMQQLSRLFRAADGKTRLDCGQNSVINLPGQKQTLLLDHARKEARVQPMPTGLTAPPPPAIPGMPSPPKPPPLPTVNVKDLGKKIMDGHEVHGKEYTLSPPHVQLPHFPMPPLPAVPQAHLPKMDAPKVDVPKVDAPKVDIAKLGAPKLELSKLQSPKLDIPGFKAEAPKLPPAPAAPKPPEVPAMLPVPPPLPPPSPVVTEVWTSTQHSIPMLTKTTGSFGQQMSQCKRLVPGEPPPHIFQIPAGYKIVA